MEQERDNFESDDYLDTTPYPEVLLSMRDFGYTLETALADVIDNSISAGARNINLWMAPGDNPTLAIIDDGTGMSQKEIAECLRLACKNPQDSRLDTDLGRFGLGLKTASLSQCKRFTVVSSVEGNLAGAVFDLDEVIRNSWHIPVIRDFSDIPWIANLPRNGTMVLWEKIDRITDGTPHDEIAKHAKESLARATKHLELVFHRYLSGEPGIGKVTITRNGDSLVPFDPFFQKKSEKTCPEEDIGGVKIQVFTLPYHKRVSKSEFDYNAGEDGYLENQGFYVYRNRRLISRAKWFGLIKPHPSYNLTRIRIDIDSELDSEWKIDVKKASVQPPRHVKARLKEIVDHFAGGSKRIFTKRGVRAASEARYPGWVKEVGEGGIVYMPNLEHPEFINFEASLGEGQEQAFKSLMHFLSATLPLELMYVDIMNSPHDINCAQRLSIDELEKLLLDLIGRCRSDGLSDEDTRFVILREEPFKSRSEEASDILERNGLHD